MKAFVFPGQGSQFPVMGSDLYKSNEKLLFRSSSGPFNMGTKYKRCSWKYF